MGWGSAALLLAAAPIGVLPAYGSSPADLAVRISGAQSADIPGEQVLTATVVNRGPGRASGVTLRFAGRVDSEAVNPEDLRFCLPRHPSAPPTLAASLTAEIHGSCPLPDLAPGRSHGLRSVLRGQSHTLGAIGEMTVVVGHAGADPAPADNTATTRLGLTSLDSYRLYARTWGGTADLAEPSGPGGSAQAVPPGSTGTLHFEIGNAGSAPVNGFTVTIRLPRRVAFAQVHPACAYAPDRRSATCTYGDVPLVPADADTRSDDRSYSALRFRHGFKVDRAAPVRARLDDGLLIVEPLVTGYLPPPVTRLPGGVTGLRARDFAWEDARDQVVIVTGAALGDGTGAGDPGAGARAGLPVTGLPVGSLGAAGLGLIVAGVTLLLLAHWHTRRARRTPAARTPAARRTA